MADTINTEDDEVLMTEGSENLLFEPSSGGGGHTPPSDTGTASEPSGDVVDESRLNLVYPWKPRV